MLVSSTGGLLFVFNRNLSFLAFVIIITFSFFFIGKGIKKSIFYSSFLAFLVVIALFAINFVFAIDQSLTKYYFYGIIIFTTVLTLFYFNNQSNKEAFINSLYFVLKIILFHSLLSFIAYFFVKDNLFLLTQHNILGEISHKSLTYNYLFYYSPKDSSVLNLYFGTDLQRNAGIFWEAGILQAYLNILFFLEISVFKRNKTLLALIILAILSTESTTGLLLLMIQVIYFLHKEYKKNIALVLIGVIATPLYFFLSANMNEKIYGEGESSFQKRLIDLTQPFFIALENPLTGVGLDNENLQEVREEFYIKPNLNKWFGRFGIEQKTATTSKGLTNSVMYMLAGMGFPTAMLFIYMFMKQQIVTNHRSIWFIITFISVMSEPLLFRPFFLIFIISGFIHFFYKVTNHKKQLV